MTYILAIDQGTSSTKTILFDEQGNPFAKGSEPLKTSYLDNGFVEQAPEDIFQNVLTSVEKCLTDFKIRGGVLSDIKSCGISNQRETFVVWDKIGKPLYDAVVWQCKRSIEICERWKKLGYETDIRSLTGLLIDPYFSGSKLVWLYENNPNVRTAVETGNAYFGTIDTWLLYRLTNGTSYFTDYTNASRTLFFNLKNLEWDAGLLNRFGLSTLKLPGLNPSAAFFGETNFNGLLPFSLAITGMIGDSHAAAFGEGCFTPGTAKATLGTGCSILMNTGKQPTASKHGMVTTICWSMEDMVQYALEGVIVSCGSTIEWVKNELGLFSDSKQTSNIANSVADNGGVYLIPAFSGLGAPYWEMNRKAVIAGLNFGSTKNHIIRAALESIPYQINDVTRAMETETGINLNQLMVDGGITSNEFVMQFLADILNKPVVTIRQPDVSALGAAYMAGLKAGIYKSIEHLAQLNSDKKTYAPVANNKTAIYYEGWKKTIAGNRG
jgi:glycerol kinase